jgi:hypothetical protein
MAGAKKNMEKLFTSGDAETVVIGHGGELWEFKVKKLTWSQRNQLLSKSVNYSKGGQAGFDIDSYSRDYLAAALVDAPWGATTHEILVQLDQEFGQKLEAVVIPSPFGSSADQGLEPFANGSGPQSVGVAPDPTTA